MKKRGEGLLRTIGRAVGLVEPGQLLSADRLWAIRPGVTLEPRLEIDALDGDDGGFVVAIDASGEARIPVVGTLAKSPSLLRAFGCSSAPTLPEIESAVLDATADPAVRSIRLDVDSPGGTVAGTVGVADAVFAARGVKPVRAVIADQGCSAAYWIASQADTIEAGQTASVGSIGAFGVVEDWSKNAEGEGVKVHVVGSGGVKGRGVKGTEVTPEHLESWQSEVDAVNAVFLEHVARGRGMELEAVEALADGRVHVGRHALEAGLVDSITGAADSGRLVATSATNGATTEGEGMANDAKPVALNVTTNETATAETLEALGLAKEAQAKAEALAKKAEERLASIERDGAKAAVEEALRAAAIAPAVLADGKVLEQLIDLKVADSPGYDVFLKALTASASIAGLVGAPLAEGDDTGEGPTSWDARTPEAKALHAKRGLTDDAVKALDEKYGFMKSLAPTAQLSN